MISLQSVQRTRVSDRVTEQILELIEFGALKPGDKLPSEAELMEQTGVGRPSLRAALRTLEVMNIIEIKQGVGAFVREVELPDIIIQAAIAKLYSQPSILNAIAIRRMLEPEIAAAAAAEATDAKLEPLHQALQALATARSDGKYPKEAHINFHMAVAEVLDNQLLNRILRFILNLWEEGLDRAFELGPADHGDPSRIVQEHQPLYDAIAARDSALARQRMSEHIAVTAKRMERRWQCGASVASPDGQSETDSTPVE